MQFNNTLGTIYCSRDLEISEIGTQSNVEGFSKIRYYHDTLHEYILYAVKCIENKYIEANFNSERFISCKRQYSYLNADANADVDAEMLMPSFPNGQKEVWN